MQTMDKKLLYIEFKGRRITITDYLIKFRVCTLLPKNDIYIFLLIIVIISFFTNLIINNFKINCMCSLSFCFFQYLYTFALEL